MTEDDERFSEEEAQVARERTNLSMRVREAYGWGPSELAKRLRVDPKTVKRRETWDTEPQTKKDRENPEWKPGWRQRMTGEEVTVHELMLACHQLGIGWIVDKVTSGAWSMDSLRQELHARGGSMMLDLERVAMVFGELLRQLELAPKTNQLMRHNTIMRLREAKMSLEEELREIRENLEEAAPPAAPPAPEKGEGSQAVMP